MQETKKHISPRPAKAVPPGATIRSELKARGISQVMFANTIERPVQFVSELLNGKRELTADTARRLEAALDIPAGFWLRYEAEYRLTKSSLDPELATRIREKALTW